MAPRPLDARRALWACALALLVCGCSIQDYFRPAAVEPGDVTGIIPDYSTPDATLETMRRGIEDKGRSNGASAYLGGLADSTTSTTPDFHQFFSQQDATRWEEASGQPPPEDWDFVREQKFYNDFVTFRSDDFEMEWGADPASGSDDIGATLATIHRLYLVTAQAEEGAEALVIAVGYADLHLQKINGNWLITRWGDRIHETNDPSTEKVTLGFRRLSLQ